jgi:hypothetical protein
MCKIQILCLVKRKKKKTHYAKILTLKNYVMGMKLKTSFLKYVFSKKKKHQENVLPNTASLHPDYSNQIKSWK